MHLEYAFASPALRNLVRSAWCVSYAVAGEPVSVLSNRLGFSVRSLRRYCEKYAGLSPKQLVVSGRILRACASLIDRRDLALSEIANGLGFTDQSAFTNDRAASAKGRVVLVSEHLENVPAGWKARYTYEFRGADEYHGLFELDPDGKGFKPYVSGNFLRDPVSPK